MSVVPAALRRNGTGQERGVAAGRREDVRPRRGRWLLPAGVALFVLGSPASGLVQLMAVLVGLGLIALVARFPGPAFLVLVVVIPFQIICMAALYRLGLPAAVVRPLGLWKEAVVIGLLLAGAHQVFTRRSRLDGLDAAALVYVGFVTAYLLLPTLFVSPSTSLGAGPPLDPTVRALAYRADVMFVVVFLAVRHAPIDRRWLSRFATAVFVTGVVVSGIAFAEFLFAGRWWAVVGRSLQVQRYRADVLGVTAPNFLNNSLYFDAVGKPGIGRVGAVQFSPLALAFSLLLPLAVGVERIARQRARLWEYLGTGSIAVALLLTQTRSVLLGALFIAGAALRAAPGRTRLARTRLALVLVVMLAMTAPLALRTGLTERITAVTDTGDESTSIHLDGLRAGLEVAREQPLGQGLGTSPTVSERFDVAGRVVSENSYLQVANEVGIPTMVVFIVLLILLVRRLSRAAALNPGLPPVAALRGALLGMLVAGLFLHVWNDFDVAWRLWGGAGLALGIASRHDPRPAGNVDGRGAAVPRQDPPVIA